jgi:hypothetical protein
MIAIREKKSFPLGQVLITPPAEAVLQQAGRTFQEFLDRHASGDWGEIDMDDWNANEEALTSGARLMSVYAVTETQKVWVITEADRSCTTLLLPDDY